MLSGLEKYITVRCVPWQSPSGWLRWLRSRVSVGRAVEHATPSHPQGHVTSLISRSNAD